jgi:hypothetical protein
VFPWSNGPFGARSLTGLNGVDLNSGSNLPEVVFHEKKNDLLLRARPLILVVMKQLAINLSQRDRESSLLYSVLYRSIPQN